MHNLVRLHLSMHWQGCVIGDCLDSSTSPTILMTTRLPALLKTFANIQALTLVLDLRSYTSSFAVPFLKVRIIVLYCIRGTPKETRCLLRSGYNCISVGCVPERS